LTADLAKMPHLLIAGRTGTGKSVCLNSIIVSLLMTRTPEQVRMLMIDPKMVEMTAYKKIPHLMNPVITDMKKAEVILAWTVTQMEERYQLLASAGVKQLSEYNRLNEDELRRRMEMIDIPDEQWSEVPKKMPYIVVFADEMADLMMTAAKEVESHIIRLAQKSRAVGIHLVLATQKPTVNVITGLIKSNLPARIAFGVASGMDSKVVLDRTGAERLLGNGDMLFLQPGTSDVIRGQGTYVSDDEIDAVIKTIAVEEPDYIEELLEIDKEAVAETEETFDDNGERVSRDDLYYDAVEFVIQQGRGSVSLLQRRFSIGYGRASRMIDFMAEDGIVGAYRGSKPREVTISLPDWRRKRGNRPVSERASSSAPAIHAAPHIQHYDYVEEGEFIAT
jgi:S-DNA-T family DNA segregation ATPase FtsK/SpoIIIE